MGWGWFLVVLVGGVGCFGLLDFRVRVRFRFIEGFGGRLGVGEMEM